MWSLTSAIYTQAFAYDAMGRLTSSPTGSYTYGDSSHVHAVTTIGASAYSASYDAAGDMTCRVLNTTIHCPSSPIVQLMSYDNERRMTHWQNKPSSATATDDYLYDGSGSRVEQQSVVSGTTTDTAYLMGGIEDISGGVVTKYLGVAGLPTALRVGTSGALNYLATDGLGSVSEALDGSGNVVAAQLYTPYGQTRYSSGTMPTSKGFTGQRADAVSGLDYYGARYYDPVAGQFTEADSAHDGLSPFAYVKGNPETFTDPTGKVHVCGTCGDGGHGGGSGGKGDGNGSSGTGGCGKGNSGGGDSCTRPHSHGSGSDSGRCPSGISCNGGYFVQPLCQAETYCLSGDDSTGLTSLLGSNLGDASTVIANGQEGLKFLIDKLSAIRDAGFWALTNLSIQIGLAATAAGAAAALAALFGPKMLPIAAFFGLAALTGANAAADVFSMAITFYVRMNSLVRALQGIHDQSVYNGLDLTHTEFEVSERNVFGVDLGWVGQTFDITEVNQIGPYDPGHKPPFPNPSSGS